MKSVRLYSSDFSKMILNETDFPTLQYNATKVGHGKRDERAFQYLASPLRFTLFEASKTLLVEADIVNERSAEDGVHTSSIMFEDVNVVEEESDKTFTFKGSDNQTHIIEIMNWQGRTVKVKCTCLDFYWRWANNNNADNSLIGPPPPPYQKKTGRPAANPTNLPGVCKHLIKAARETMLEGVTEPL